MVARVVGVALLLVAFVVGAWAAEPCQKFHGRVVFYSADGQLRLWHVGTRHEFEPGYYGSRDDASWDRIVTLLKHWSEELGAAGNYALFADFVVCPVEPFKQGSVQQAVVKRMSRVRIIPRDQDGEPQ